jgi:hypothetical protein
LIYLLADFILFFNSQLTCRAIAKSSTSEQAEHGQTEWLAYWVFFAAIVVLESITDLFVLWLLVSFCLARAFVCRIPMYYFVKVFVLVYAMGPYGGGNKKV